MRTELVAAAAAFAIAAAPAYAVSAPSGGGDSAPSAERVGVHSAPDPRDAEIAQLQAQLIEAQAVIAAMREREDEHVTARAQALIERGRQAAQQRQAQAAQPAAPKH